MLLLNICDINLRYDRHRSVGEIEVGLRYDPKAKHWDGSLYNMCMLKCWRKDPLQRPTFDFLHALIDDFFVATEPDYW